MTPWLTQIVFIVANALVLVGCGPVLNTSKSKIPEELLIRLQPVQNSSEFLNLLSSNAPLQRAYLVQGDDVNSEIEVARPAGCVPEMQIVEFDRPHDTSVVLWPMCTRVRRCGGCCSSTMLHCVPTVTSTLTVKIIKARYPRPGADTLELEGYDVVSLEQHDRCSCQCRQKASDCGPLQRYQPEECRCVCVNHHESEPCTQPERYWDASACTCKCREQPDCSTGSSFNDKTCKCESRNNLRNLFDHNPGPAPHLLVPLKDDGGENDDAYRLRYSTMEDPHMGPFSLSHYESHESTVLLDNATQTQWTEN